MPTRPMMTGRRKIHGCARRPGQWDGSAGAATVNDAASMRQMVTFTLQGAGSEVVEAQDGEQALGIAQSTKVNLALTDVNMPTCTELL